MTDTLTPAEARAWNAAVEAAAREANALADEWRWSLQHDGFTAADMDNLGAAIRALSVPIPPEPDAEAAVTIAKSSMIGCRVVHEDDAGMAARAVVAALTAAGMLRQP